MGSVFFLGICDHQYFADLLCLCVIAVRIIDDEDLCAFLQLFIEMLLHMRIQREPHARPGFDLPGILRGSHDDRFFVPA